MEDTKLILSGLNSLDREELRKAIGDKGVEFLKPSVPEGTLAEPATITAVIYLSGIALSALTVWISKKKQSRIRKYKHKVIHPDGTIEEVSWDFSDSSEDAVEPKVMEQLSKWVKPPGGS